MLVFLNKTHLDFSGISQRLSGSPITALPILFLAGKGNLIRDFTPSIGELPAGAPPNSIALKLVPKAAQPDYDWLLLVVDRQSLSLRALVTMDAEGGQSSIAFAKLKENVNPADKEFAFNIPRGADVIN